MRRTVIDRRSARRRLQAALVAGLALAAPARAELLSYFNFNNAAAGTGGGLGTFNATGSPETFDAGAETISPASQGVFAGSAVASLADLNGAMGGTANNNWGTFGGDVLNAVGADPAGQALAVAGSGNNGRFVQFSVPTAGEQDIAITYATRGTGTGFNTHTWQYSTDGVNFTDFATIGGRNVTSYSVQTVDFSAVSALDNLATAHFRLVFTGATAVGGNNRVDNVQIQSDFVPGRDITWTANAGNNWNTVEANWAAGGSSTAFVSGDRPAFGDLGAGTVNIDPAGVAPGAITVNSAANYTFTGGEITGGAPLTKGGAGTLALATPNPSWSGPVTVNGGKVTVGSAAADGTPGTGKGLVTVNSGGTFEINNVAVGSFTGFAFALNLNDGSTVQGLGDARTRGSGSPNIANSGRVVFRAPSAGDSLLLGNSVRVQNAGSPSTTVISAEGAGAVRLASGGVSQFTNTQYNGAWEVNMDQATGVLSVGPVEAGGFGETLNALGYTTGSPRGAGRPVTVNSGTLAIGSDTWNPAANGALTGLTSFRSPVTLAGGKIASTGFSIDTAATTTGTGAVFSATPVTANLAGDLTVAAGTSTVLLHDPVAGAGAGPRSVRITTDPQAANATSPSGGPELVRGNLTWAGTLELEPAGTTGGALVIDRDVASTFGAVNVTPGAQITVKPGSALLLAGPGGTLSDGADHVNVLNNSAAGLSVTSGSHAVGNVTGLGNTSVTSGGASLTASVIQQDTLAIGNGATATVGAAPGAAPTPSTLSTLAIEPGGTLDLADNQLTLNGATAATAAEVRGLLTSGHAGGAWTGAGIRSSVAAAGSGSLGYAFGGDGVVSGLAADQLLVRYTLPGDANLDGIVDVTDLGSLATNWDLTGREWVDGDSNYDGVVDVTDLGLLATNWDTSAPLGVDFPAALAAFPQLASAVPEPAAGCLLAAGGVALLRRRPRPGKPSHGA